MESELWFSFDGHGSTRVLLDVVGAAVQLFAYDAYGQAIGFNPADALTEFLFSGEQFDAKIGQQYLRDRYYDPATGRFNRLDPFFGNNFDPQSFHKYLYAHSDPITYFDPTGRSAVMAAFASIVGGLAGAVIGGYSGYVQAVAAYGLEGMEDGSANIAGILWAIVGASAGAAPGAYLGKQYAVAGFGTGALQGALDAAAGGANPIYAAIEGLANAILGAGVGGVLQLLTGSGLVCKLAMRFPLAANALGGIAAGAGIGFGAYGAYQSYKDGNNMQALLRVVFTAVDIIAIAKTIKICFTEETPVLQYEDGNYEPMIVLAENALISERGAEAQSSHISYIAAGLISSAFVASQVISIRKKTRKEEGEANNLRTLRNKLIFAEN